MAPVNAGLSKTEARLLSNDVLLPELLENESKRIQLLEFLMMYRIAGDRLRLSRVGAASLGGDPDLDTVPVTVQEGQATPDATATVFELKLLVQDVYVRDFAEANLSAVMSQSDVQLIAAVKRFMYAYSDAVLNGNTLLSPEKFDGLEILLRGSQAIFPNDTTNYYFTLDDLARVVSLVKNGGGWGPMVIVVSAEGWINVVKAYYDAGVAPEYIEMEFQDENGCRAVRRVLSFRGIPVLVDDHVPVNLRVGTFFDGTSLYVFRVGKGGVYGITATPEGGPQILVRERIDEDESVTCYRLIWSIGLVLEAEGSAAKLTFRRQPETIL